MPAPQIRRSRARRVLGVIGAVVGTTVTFVTATAAAAVVHLDAAPTRRVVANQANGILKKQFLGDIQVERIAGLGLRGLDGVRVRIKDPTGLQVLYVDSATVHVRTLDLVRSALFGKGDIIIPVDLVSLGHVDANIDGDPQGNLRIANVFNPRTQSAPSPPSNPNARGISVEVPKIDLDSAWIHGQAPAAPPLDAELHQLAAHAHYDGKLIKADLDKVDLVTRGLPRGVDPHGRVGGSFSMPSATGQSMGVSGAFDGIIAGVPTTAHGGMDGQKIDATVDGRDPDGEGVRSTFGETVISQEVVLHAEAHGTLPKIDALAHVAVGKGTVDVDGHVDLTDGTKGKATVKARHIDLHGILAKLPASDVGADTTANVTLAKSGAMSGDMVLLTMPGQVAGQSLPILDMKAQFTDRTGHAAGQLRDPRANAQFVVDLKTEGTARIVTGKVHSDLDDLSRLPVVGKDMKGHATVDADGTVNLGTRMVSAKTHLIAGGLQYQDQKVDNVSVLATVDGSMDKPIVDVGVHAGGLQSGKEKIGVADVRGQIAQSDGMTAVRAAQIDIVRKGHNIGVHADLVEIGGDHIGAEGVIISGLGEPLKLDGTKDGSEIRAKIDAPKIDLVLAATLAGQTGLVRSGTASIKGDVDLRGRNAKGDIQANIDNFSTGDINGAKLMLGAKIDGHTVDVNMDAELNELGTVKLVTKRLTLGGNPADPRSWQTAHGAAKFDANLNLSKLTSFIPPDRLPVSELAGQVVVAGAIKRDSAKVPPELSMHVHTRGLVAAGISIQEQPHDPTHGEQVTGVQPWRIEGMDASFDASVDATSGLAEVAFHVVDDKGSIAAFDAKSFLPYQEMYAHPERAQDIAEKTPFNARLVIPKRLFSDMPPVTGIRSTPGSVEAQIDITGTALQPNVEMWAHARDVRSPSLSDKLAANVDVDFKYDGQKADLAAKVMTGKKDALDATAHFDVNSQDLLKPKDGKPLAWGGSANVKMAAFPLEAVAPLADRRIKGKVSGTVAITDLHKDAKLDTNIAFDQLKIGQAQYKSGKIVVANKDGKVNAQVRLDQTDGYLDLSASTGLKWGDALVPSPDPSVETQAHLEAKAFRAAAIRPFVGGSLNELDGRIDANATVKLAAGFKDPTMDGTVNFHDGTLQVAALGEEYKNVKANVSFQPGGLVKIDDIYLKGTTGELTGSASVKTRGLGLDSAQAQIEIPQKRPLDLSIQGNGFGGVSGKVTIAAQNSADGKTLNVNVNVPTLAVTLPQKLKAGVQDLATNPDIRVGVFRDEKHFVKLPLSKADVAPVEPKKPSDNVMLVDVKLGEVTVVDGNMARVVLTGEPKIKIGNTTEMTGQITLKPEVSKVDVQGKTFKVEKATVTFQSTDISNPVIIATAGYTAEDGTKIYADFVGPVKTGKVTLRSEPSMPRNEILAIILFGTADGANAPPPANGGTNQTTKAAVGVGGGFATQGLTEALDDLTGIQAQAKIDTSRSANPAPEIEIQLAKKFSVEFEHVLGTPPISEPDVDLATVEWRFKANWSLDTTVGNAGLFQTDAVWTKRY